MTRQFKPIHSWHLQINQADLGVELTCNKHRGGRVVGDPNPATQEFHDRGQGIGTIGMIIHNEVTERGDCRPGGGENIADAVLDRPGRLTNSLCRTGIRELRVGIESFITSGRGGSSDKSQHG